MDFNASSPSLRGMEWRPSSIRKLTLNNTRRGVAQRFRAAAATTVTSVHRWLETSVGPPGIGVEILDTLVPTAAETVFRPNEDLSISKFVNQAGSSTVGTLFPSVDEADLDAADYVQGTGTNAQVEFRFNTAASLAGQRVTELEFTVWSRSTGGSGYLFLYVNLAGLIYQLDVIAVPVSAVPLPWTVRSRLNPATGLPWTVAEVRLLDSTDEVRVKWVGFNGLATVQVAQLYLTVRHAADNRKGFFYGIGPQSAGWREVTLASTSALTANTWYWVHEFPFTPNLLAGYTVPLLRDPTVVQAVDAASVGEHRVAYETDRHQAGTITAAREQQGTMIPMLLQDVGGIMAQSQPFVELDEIGIYSGSAVNVGTEVTSAAGATTYAAVKLPVLWAAKKVRPDQPMTVEVRSGAGAITGGGTLHATATVPMSVLTDGTARDVQVAFVANFTTAAGATQYFVRFLSGAHSWKAWRLFRLDSRSDLVTLTTAAEVQGATQGGTADSYFTAGVEDDRYDLPVALVAAPAAPAGLTVTPRAAA